MTDYNPSYSNLFCSLVDKFNSSFLEGNWWNCIKTMRLMITMLPPDSHDSGEKVIATLVDDIQKAESLARDGGYTTAQKAANAELIAAELILTARKKLQSLVEQSGINKMSSTYNYEVNA